MSMMFFPVVLRNPDGPLAIGLSLFPMATPLLMFLRISLQPPPAWQIGLSIVLMVGVTFALLASLSFLHLSQAASPAAKPAAPKAPAVKAPAPAGLPLEALLAPEIAGLALAAQIAGGDGAGDEDGEVNPFLGEGAGSAPTEDGDEANPFLSGEDEAEKEDAPA